MQHIASHDYYNVSDLSIFLNELSELIDKHILRLQNNEPNNDNEDRIIRQTISYYLRMKDIYKNYEEKIDEKEDSSNPDEYISSEDDTHNNNNRSQNPDCKPHFAVKNVFRRRLQY